MQQVQVLKRSTAAEIVTRVMQVFAQKKNIRINCKNIQRRTYDSLNVLAALNIIVRDKFCVEWVGIFQNEYEPTEKNNCIGKNLLGKIKLQRLVKYQ